MRPLETKAQKEARETRNKTLIGLFIVIIMVLSAVGYVMWGRESPEEQNSGAKTYNNHTFAQIEQGWLTETSVSGETIQIVTSYFPDELENTTLDSRPFLSDFMGKKIYVIANSIDERHAATDFAYSLQNIVEKMQLACSPEEENETFCLENNLPIRSCGNADDSTAVIFIDENATASGFSDGCLTISGKGSDLTKAADKAIFAIFKIIE